jgi:hypothetical protein
LHDVACVEEACKESVQKIKENAGMRKVEKECKKGKLQLEWRNALKTSACGESI